MNVRRATGGDGPALAGLLEQLGYPASEHQVARRFAGFASDSAGGLLVAEEEDGRLLGLAAFTIPSLIERDDTTCLITALVVDEDSRRRGIGRALMDAVEREARLRGAGRLELASDDRGEGAHGFYERLGFTSRPMRFVREL